ncbi:uncharacterized protein LOC62_02G002777 [Vanrija pseudolonga]|uniref:Uncharacterized protein n=1 Tax=Vanrija pseudolonga TaxID=143232 RepID=A0AAF0Y6P9_9TREE|nr:hypothetical protein LOC62_02G002777 [Vanrija pseudolonga]
MPPFPIPDITLPDPPTRKTRSGSAASLHLARSRSSLGSTEEAGLLVGSGAGPGGRRRASFALTPITRKVAADERDSDDNDEDDASVLSPLPPSPLTPTTLEANTARWAATQRDDPADRTPDADIEAHPRISLSHRAVQFADEDDIEVFDASEADTFEKPVGSEMLAIVLSCSMLAVIATAAALTTMYDWVL